MDGIYKIAALYFSVTFPWKRISIFKEKATNLLVRRTFNSNNLKIDSFKQNIFYALQIHTKQKIYQIFRARIKKFDNKYGSLKNKMPVEWFKEQMNNVLRCFIFTLTNLKGEKRITKIF